MFDFEDLLLFAENKGYENKPFKYVIKKYKEEMYDYFISMQADDYLSTIEAHEIINF